MIRTQSLVQTFSGGASLADAPLDAQKKGAKL